MTDTDILTSKKNVKYPLVSILIRTCCRPDILRGALESVRAQTYPNIEVVIIEDGNHTADFMLREEYADMRYVYRATGMHVGRSKAGNLAMSLAEGKYFNFLDDDDAFLPDHVWTLVRAMKNRYAKAAYSVAQERAIRVRSEKGKALKVKKKYIRFRQEFNRLLLYTENYIPIQSIMFDRSLYEKAGGLDETLDALEDWDLWVRYSMETDFIFVDKVTSYYHVPWNRKIKKERALEMKNYLCMVYQKFQNYHIEVSVDQINKEMLYVLRKYKERKMLRYIRLAVRVLLLGER